MSRRAVSFGIAFGIVLGLASWSDAARGETAPTKPADACEAAAAASAIKHEPTLFLFVNWCHGSTADYKRFRRPDWLSTGPIALESVEPIERDAVRGVVLDRQDRVLLVLFRDGAGQTWWATTGGGANEGERPEETLRRDRRSASRRCRTYRAGRAHGRRR